jgi:CDP-alcohol phosphatidyltransferase-like enzyme
MSNHSVRLEAKSPPLLRAVFASLRDWETQALVDRWLYRPIDQALVRMVPRWMRPNHVSVLSGVVGFVAAACYLEPTYAWTFLAGLLLAFSNVLDGVDGQLARARNECSETGKLIDNVMDPAKTILVMFGIAIGMQRAGTWGSIPLFTDLPMLARIYSLGLLTGASFTVQVLSRNLFVDLYRRHGKGTSDPNVARLHRVRAELEQMRARGGFWLERVMVPMVLVFQRDPGPPPPAESLPPPDPSYVAQLKPYIRLWTFLGGGTQFTILVFSSLAGTPVVGWLLIAGLLNVLYVPLLFATLRAHRRAIEGGALEEAAR